MAPVVEQRAVASANGARDDLLDPRLSARSVAAIAHDAVLSRFVSGLSSRDTRLLRELLASDTGPADSDPGPAGDQG